jgi:hypothetical protein
MKTWKEFLEAGEYDPIIYQFRSAIPHLEELSKFITSLHETFPTSSRVAQMTQDFSSFVTSFSQVHQGVVAKAGIQFPEK